MSDVDLEQLSIDHLVCPYCQAAPGEWCITYSGEPSTVIHAKRLRLLDDVWMDGFLAGTR